MVEVAPQKKCFSVITKHSIHPHTVFINLFLKLPRISNRLTFTRRAHLLLPSASDKSTHLLPSSLTCFQNMPDRSGNTTTRCYLWLQRSTLSSFSSSWLLSPCTQSKPLTLLFSNQLNTFIKLTNCISTLPGATCGVWDPIGSSHGASSSWLRYRCVPCRSLLIIVGISQDIVWQSVAFGTS